MISPRTLMLRLSLMRGGHALHPGDVLGDALAHLAVAAGDGVDDLAVAVDASIEMPSSFSATKRSAGDGAVAVLVEELLAPRPPGVELLDRDRPC